MRGRIGGGLLCETLVRTALLRHRPRVVLIVRRRVLHLGTVSLLIREQFRAQLCRDLLRRTQRRDQVNVWVTA